MLIILVCGIVGVIWSYVELNKGEKEFCVFVGVLSGLGGAIISLVLGAVLAGFMGMTEVKVSGAEIASFVDSSSVSGSFFLGCGTIRESNHYFVYEVASDGGIEQNHFDVERTKLYESNDLKEMGRVEKYKNVLTCDPKGLFFLRPDTFYYKIYVPKGTIIRQFRADLE